MFIVEVIWDFVGFSTLKEFYTFPRLFKRIFYLSYNTNTKASEIIEVFLLSSLF